MSVLLVSISQVSMNSFDFGLLFSSSVIPFLHNFFHQQSPIPQSFTLSLHSPPNLSKSLFTSSHRGLSRPHYMSLTTYVLCQSFSSVCNYMLSRVVSCCHVLSHVVKCCLPLSISYSLGVAICVFVYQYTYSNMDVLSVGVMRP